MRAAIFGASGGIGGALAMMLAQRGASRVYAGSRSGTGLGLEGIEPFAFDLADEASIAAACAGMIAEGPLDLVFVATGVLHRAPAMMPEKSVASLNADAMLDLFRVNTIGPALIAKHAIAALPRDRRCVFAALSARVGSISDNKLGGWHSYRASKAALNMLIANLAIELRRTHPFAIAVGLHPGTVATPLSQPFQRTVPTDRLFTPAYSAERLLAVIADLSVAQSGSLIAWDGSVIAP